MSKKQIIILSAVMAILILGGAAFGSYYFWQKLAGIVSQKACTMEAKLCPDGSAVSRSGPNCEFAACPNNQLVGNDRDEHGCIGSAGYSWCQEKQKCLRIWEEKCETASTTEMADWQTYKNEKYGFEIKYPVDFKISINPPGSTVVLRFINSKVATCDMYVGPIYNGIPDLLAPQSSTQKNKVITDVTMAGNKGKRIQQEEYGLDAGLVTTYAGYIVRDNLHYLFSCVFGKPINYNDGALFDQILSTFKFTK